MMQDDRDRREYDLSVKSEDFSAAFAAVKAAIVADNDAYDAILTAINNTRDAANALRLLFCVLGMGPRIMDDKLIELHACSDPWVGTRITHVAFQALAPFVRKGSYVRYGEHLDWRYYFDGEKVVKQHAHLVWDQTIVMED
jgi:hypothetical protein